MSKFAGFIIGAAEIVAGVVLLGTPGGQALGTELIVMGVATVVSQAVVDLTMPKGNASRNALETELQLGEAARRAIFGKAATAGSLVDAFDYGGKYGTDNEVVIFALCDHKVEELVGVYVNDVWVPWAGDGNYPQFDEHHLSMYFRDGSETQTLPSVVTTHGAGWTSNDYGAGVCYAVVDYLSDSPTAEHPAWPGGRPTFLWVVKGKKCYDPRLDDTVGGTGAHRWDDPATWEWSDNPIVCAYNWRRGIYACDRVDQPEMLLVGRGLTPTEAPPAYIFADANLCDEDVSGAARYSIGGVIAADEHFIDVEEKFAAACGGIIIQPEGTVQIEPAQARTPSFTFTDDDIIVGTSVEYNQGILSQASNDWINTTIPTYVEPRQKWSDHAAPVRRVASDVTADGGAREEQIQLQLVTVERQASDIAEIHRKLGRFWGRGSVVLGPPFAEVEEGDWGIWISDRLRISMTVRVEGYGLDQKYRNALSLRQISSSVYDGVYAEGSGSSTGSATDWEPTPVPPDIGTPDAGNWALTAATLDSAGVSVPALHIEGDSSDDPYADPIRVEYWEDDGVIDPVANPDDPAWIIDGSYPPSATFTRDITSVVGGGTYYVAITYIVDGETGDRLVLGPVTLSDYAPTAFYQLEDSFTPVHLEDDSTLVHLG